MTIAGLAASKRGRGTGSHGPEEARASRSARTVVGPSKSQVATRAGGTACHASASTFRKHRASTNPAAASAASKATGRDVGQTPVALPGQENEGVPGLSALSVADAVVTEYEKLLAAIPTMAKHMGKLQSDTEAMAEGLGKRVRGLVAGYRELNELVDQAPSRVSNAASEYANTLGVRPRGSESPIMVDVADGHVAVQAPDIDRIHKELFALREAKLAIDCVVMGTSADLQDPIVEHSTTASSRRRRGVGSALDSAGLSTRAITTGAGESRNEQLKHLPGSSVTAAMLGGSRGGRAGDVAAARARAISAATKRSTVRRVLAEVQLDPDLPLPLPTFPGHESAKPLGKSFRQQMGSQGQYSNGKQLPHTGDLRQTSKHAKVTEVPNHGYFVPGVVAPRQRQSHGLPEELRAIFTIPDREQRPVRAVGSSGKRRRVRSRPTASSIGRGKATAPLSDPQTAMTSENRRVGVSCPRPDPGSAAAMALSREQRKYTSQAVGELRKEMREREGRLERELDRLRRSRVQRVEPAPPSAFGGASDRDPLKVVSRSVAVVGRSGAGLASRGRGSRGRRSLPRVSASQKKPAATSRAPVDMEKIRGKEHIESSQPGNKPAETVDAQAQTTNERVHLFLPPEPNMGDALRKAADKRPLGPGIVLPNKSIDQAQQTRLGMDSVGDHHFDDASCTSSSVSGGDTGLSRQLGGGRRESPPPPVVFIEGEGRNAAWRPSDDDRLLRRGAGGNGGGSLRSRGTTVRAGAEVMREVVDGGDARLVLISAAEDTEEGAESKPRAIRLTTGRLEVAASTSQQLEGGVQDDVWVELAGMLGLSACDPTRAALSDTSAQAEQPATGGAGCPLKEAPMVSPELLNLIREVVGQQRDMGEERSALMQALRAEMESRRLLLANQELSLKERELAFEKRESESMTASTLPRLAAAAAAATTAAIAEHHRQQERDGHGTITIDGVDEVHLPARSSQEERFWPATGDQEAEPAEPDSESRSEEPRAIAGKRNNGAAKKASVVEIQEEQGNDGRGEACRQQPLHAFRSNLGRVLAAGNEWRDVPLDEVEAPERAYATSLGRLLTGGPAWQQRRHGGRSSASGGTYQGTTSGSNNHIRDPYPANTIRTRGELDVQELLWEPDKQGGGGVDAGLLSPETAGRKRASALESRKFQMVMAEARRPTEGETEDGESELSASDEDTRIQPARRERHVSSPPVLQKHSPSIATQPEQQPQHQDTGRLNLSLATAVLSVAQTLSTVEERASAKAQGAEGLARQALEETRREGKEARERQSEVMLRLREIEHGSERRAKAVARDIAELREEGRLERQQIYQHPPQVYTLPRQSSLKGGGDSSTSSESGRSLDALCLAAVPLETSAPYQPTPARSESRSSMSEGQLRGYFSDGELLRSTTGSHSRYTLEDGEIPAPPLQSPRPARVRKGSVIEAVGSIEGKKSGRKEDPRQHLTLLISAHPHLEANRPSVRDLRKQAHDHDNSPSGSSGETGIYGGSGPRDGVVSMRGSVGTSIQMDGGSSRTWRLTTPEPKTKLTLPDEVCTLENRVSDGGNGTSLSDSGQDPEPGQARPGVRRSWQESGLLTSERGGGTCDRGAVAGQIELGSSWLRQRRAASEDSFSSAGEASSGMEVGETFAVLLEESIDALSIDARDAERVGTGARVSRPLVALKVGGGSLKSGGRTAEIQRAIAEAELDLRSSATDCNLNGPDSANSAGGGIAADWSKAARGRHIDGIAVSGDLFAEEMEEAPPDEVAGPKERLEPGQIT